MANNISILEYHAQVMPQGPFLQNPEIKSFKVLLPESNWNKWMKADNIDTVNKPAFKEAITFQKDMTAT